MSRQHHHNSSESIDPTFTSRARSTWSIVGRVAKYIRPYPWMAFSTMACALLSTLLSFAYPKLTQFLIDGVIGGGRGDLLGLTIVGLIGAFFFRDLFNSIRIRINNTFPQNFIYYIRRDVYSKLQLLPFRYF